MTAGYLFGLAVGTLAGILGTLTALAIRRRPRRLEMDEQWEAVRRLDRPQPKKPDPVIVEGRRP